MSIESRQRSEEFLRVADQFKLGALTTEASHSVTADLSAVAQQDTAAGLKLLFDVDDDVVRKYRQFAHSGRADEIAATVRGVLERGGKIFFTGCGSTGRLSIQLVSIWRDFWQRQGRRRGDEAQTERQAETPHVVFHHGQTAADWEQRALAVMAGGDFALIKAVEGFEDFNTFGKRQIADQGVAAGDVVFAITEGGETSFVIGTAWQGVAVGAKVYFVYNNPDDVLCQQVERSREVIEDPRIEKLNLTTGPMAITGSTRMQATSIQLAVMLTVLEMVVRELVAKPEPGGSGALNAKMVPAQFLEKLVEAHAGLKSPELLNSLARLVELEEGIYRAGRKNNYFVDQFGIDVLTDTTERSPTYCTPPFRKFDDPSATESWAFLFVPQAGTPHAWERIIKRRPHCVEWQGDEVRALVPDDKFARTVEIISRISHAELMRFRIGLDGLNTRLAGAGNGAVGILSEAEVSSLLAPEGFVRRHLEAARAVGGRTSVVFVGGAGAAGEVAAFLAHWEKDCVGVVLRLPPTDFLLDGVTRVVLKLVLNALSTCTMVRLGRVMGNFMIWVVPSNLKLIDRATRYIQRLTGLDYVAANHLLFEVIEYVQPRMKADQDYPPVVGMAVMRVRHRLGNREAEARLLAEMGMVR